MTVHEVVYRATVYADEDQSTVLTPASNAPHSDPFQVATAKGVTGYKPYMHFPEGGRGEIGAKSRNTSTGQVRFRILDKRVDRTTSDLERWFTAFLGGEDGQPQLGGNIVVIEESTDGGSTWEDFFTGRVQEPSLKDRQVVAVTTRDMKNDLKVPTFLGRPHGSISYGFGATLLPVGMRDSWGDLDKVPAIPATFESRITVSKLNVDVAAIPDALDGRLVVTKALRDAAARPEIKGLQDLVTIASDVLVRAEITSGTRAGETGAYALTAGRADRGLFAGLFGGMVTEDTEDGQHRVVEVGILELDSNDPLHMALPADGESVDFWIEHVGEPVEQRPLFLDDVHPVTLAKDLLDGKFNRLDTDGSTLESWDYADPDNLEGDTSYDTARFLIREKPDELWTWMVEQLFLPFGFGAYLDPSGVLQFVDLRTPDADDATGLPEITNAMIEPGKKPEWNHSRGDAVTRIDWTMYLDDVREVEDLDRGEFPDVGPALIESIEVPFSILDVGDPSLGVQEFEIDAKGFRRTSTEGHAALSDLRDFARKSSEDYRRPFGRGPEYLRVFLRRDATVVGNLTPGDFVNVDLDEIPDPKTNVRGGRRLMRVVAVDPKKNSIQVRLLDIDSSEQASEPTFDAAPASSRDSDTGAYKITQAVTPHADGPTWVEYAITAQSVSTRPGPDSALWRGMGRKSSGGIDPSVFPVGGNKRIWTRARTHAFDLLPSGWRFPSDDGFADFVDTGAVGGISNLTLTEKDAEHAVWTWDVADDGLRVKVVVTNDTQGTTKTEEILAAGATGFEVRGTVAGESYTIEVQQVDELQGAGAKASGSWTADSSPIPQAPRPVGVDPVHYLEGSGTRDYLGIAMWVFPSDPAMPMILQVAEGDGSGNPDTGTIQETKIQAGSDRFVWDATDSGLVYGQDVWLRILHRADGWNDSDPTAWHRVTLRFPPENFPNRPERADLAIDLTFDESNGDVDLHVTAPGAAAIRYWTSKSSYPSRFASGSTAVSMPDDGDVTVNSIMSLSKGERAFVTVSTFTTDPPCDPDTDVPCIAQEWAKVSELFKSDPGPDDTKKVDPTVEAQPKRTTDPRFQKFDVIGSQGPDGVGPVEVRYRVDNKLTGEGSWSTWQSSPLAVSIQKTIFEKTLVVQARDSGIAGNPTSDKGTVPIPPLFDFPDLPPLGRGPFEDDRHRSGMGGETPGGERLKSPVWNGPGDTELIDTENERMTGGDLGPGRTQNDGAGNHALSKGWDSKTGRNGDSISWDPTYDKVPSVDPPGHGGVRKRDSGWSGDGVEPGTYGPSLRLKNKDAGGGNVEAVLREPTGSITQKSIASWTVVSSGSELEADKTDPDEAWDDEYHYRHHYFVSGSSLGGDCFGSTMEVGYYFDKGSGWVQFDTNSFSSGCNDNEGDTVQTLTEDGISDTDQEGANFRVKQESGSGSISDPDSGDAVTWEEANDPKETDATPSGSAEVSFFAQATA